MAEVSEVIVARIRCWWTPCPNWTSECRSSRKNGMSRLTASSMSAWVDGPKAWRSASRMSRSSSGAKSKKTDSSSGATRWLTSATAIRPASRPTASSRYSKMQLYWPTGPAARVLPWRTSVPARFWNSSAMCSAMWPIQVPSRSRGNSPISPRVKRTLGRRCDLEAGMAKLLAARIAWANADNAVQIYGGNGFAMEFPVSRILCDARILSIFEGAAEIQAHVIARRLLDGSN